MYANVPQPPESVVHPVARRSWKKGYAAFLDGRVQHWDPKHPFMDEWAHGWLTAHSETYAALMAERGGGWVISASLLSRFKVQFNEVMNEVMANAKK